ncbi:hypothetical protein BSLG_005205 [Batrachochytrium salamandrivorans]|nr:hypothetical protein BSLG_005205 [Batrachochytrium salamandrivorans]
MSFLFGESQEISLAQLSTNAHIRKDDSPLSESPEPNVGVETSTMHFSISTKLAFGATRCELKLSDFLDQMAMEVEIPNDQIEKFTKYFGQDTIAAEIDKLHGLEPVLRRYRDVKLSGLKRTLGSTLSTVNVKSSIETLLTRVGYLESCGLNREKEVTAITEMAISQMRDTTARYTALVNRIDAKIIEKCEAKFEVIEEKILLVVRDELSFIKALPMKLSQLSAAPSTLPKVTLGRAATTEQQKSPSVKSALIIPTPFSSQKVDTDGSTTPQDAGIVSITTKSISPIGKLATPQSAVLPPFAALEEIEQRRRSLYPKNGGHSALTDCDAQPLQQELSTKSSNEHPKEAIPTIIIVDVGNEKDKVRESLCHPDKTITLEPAPMQSRSNSNLVKTNVEPSVEIQPSPILTTEVIQPVTTAPKTESQEPIKPVLLLKQEHESISDKGNTNGSASQTDMNAAAPTVDPWSGYTEIQASM